MIQRLIIIFLFACITICSDGQTHFKQPAYDTIHSGVPWFDQHGNTVSAHGAGIIKEGDRYYLFGEFKTDSANVFNGFACYSSTDLYNWTFERMALPVQEEGKLGPNRVGERPKVMKSPATGEYVMFMHVDSTDYKDQYVGYATAKTITGPYTFRGPILYQGKPIRRWDMGTFQDDDGTGYLLVHHGDIYRLSDDYQRIEAQVANDIEGAGESPAMVKKNGTYYLLTSNLTSWERNDNQYHTAPSLSGPWTEQGLFAPKGSLTWNSQCSFVLAINGSKDTTFMYMGDRWSFPKQQSAATYVWQPLTIDQGRLSIPAFQESWTVDVTTGTHRAYSNEQKEIPLMDADTAYFHGNWAKDTAGTRSASRKGDRFAFPFTGIGLSLYGLARPDGGYAEISIQDQHGKSVVETVVDMYCQYPAATLKFVSPTLKRGRYTLTVTVMGERGNWSDKRRSDYGSTGYVVALQKVLV